MNISNFAATKHDKHYRIPLMIILGVFKLWILSCRINYCENVESTVYELFRDSHTNRNPLMYGFMKTIFYVPGKVWYTPRS